jgi:hypothetical protein|tara:strand:+ start:2754 stop:2999 length:246 start_codon:yes stop_codon:yes gene_type:complete
MCELCNLEQKTHWYFDDDDWVICDCITCGTPMAVYRQHTMEIPIDKLYNILAVIGDRLGYGTTLRVNQRKIPDHYHIHILK